MPIKDQTNTPDRPEPSWFKQVPLFIGEEGTWSKSPLRAWSTKVTLSSQSGNNSSSSEIATTPHTFSFDIFGGKVCCKEDTFPLHLDGLPTASGFAWPIEAVPGNREQEEGEALFLLGRCGLTATSAQGSYLHSVPLSWSDDSRPGGVTVPVVASPQVLNHPLSVSLNPASTFEHNLSIQPFSNYSECSVLFLPVP